MNRKWYKWIAILIFLIAGLWLGMKMGNYHNIILYYPDQNAEWLVSEERRVEKVDKDLMADQLIEELIKGPTVEGHSNPIPEGTVLLPIDVESPKIKIENGCATVNLSNEFVQNHPGGSTGEAMTLGAIVNTLTELKQIDRVQILVNGQKVCTLSGHFNIEEPLTRMEELIKP